ncbi:MAG TPA: outer membrane beta-barrel protein [Longimicrobiales bacterium]|nr:outer membrane beta-barrel protein [Longimicrobiales bacterium]
MKRAWWIPIVVAAVLPAGPMAAQGPWSVEVQGGLGFPTGDLEEPLVTGPGFGAVAAFRFLPHLAVYGGWDWFVFDSGTSFAGTEVEFEETGYVLGLRFEHPFPWESRLSLAYRLHGGVTWKHLELEDDDAGLLADSGHGAGWEAGGGLTWDVTSRLYVSPGVRYRALSRDVEIDGEETGLDLAYWAWQLGVGLRF